MAVILQKWFLKDSIKKLACLILTKDESIHIERAIKNIKSLDCDIVVCDSYSSDKTIDLARENDVIIYQNEINLLKISLIDHTYENKYGYDLNKSRSFSLGYDSMLISYAISNRYQGNIKGLLGTYIVRSNSIEFISYIN